MGKSNSFATLIFCFIFGLVGGLAYVLHSIPLGVVAFAIALLLSMPIKIADQWEKVVILRLGKFRGLKGPGLFFIIPILDTIPFWVDTRVITTGFNAEKTLTKDTVPVDVDAVLFWQVIDPEKAALKVANYQSAINWASQTALRDGVVQKTSILGHTRSPKSTIVVDGPVR